MGVEVGQDATSVLANGLGQMTKGAEATARRPATPRVKFSFGELALRVRVDGLPTGRTVVPLCDNRIIK